MPSTLLVFCAVLGSGFGLSEPAAKNACSWVPEVVVQANNNNIEPSLLLSVMMVESAFRPRVVSSAGACGLTQVVPRWTGGPETKYKKYTCEQLKNPKTAIRVGAQILSYNIRVYGKGNVDKGLCFYNAGTVCLRKPNFYRKLYYVKLVKRYKRVVDDEGC